jgi:hypothetical protein
MTKYVKYIGTSHWREITGKEWAALDPPVENRTLRWDAANGWTIPADLISEHAWPYIEADAELVVIDKDYRTPESTEDSAPADPAYYPPLTTAAQAENIDTRTDVPYGVTPEDERDVDDDEELSTADVAQADLPDQETASVADIRYTGGSKTGRKAKN